MGPALTPCLSSEALSSSSVSPLTSSMATPDGSSSGVSSCWHTTCPCFYIIMLRVWLKRHRILQIRNTYGCMIRNSLVILLWSEKILFNFFWIVIQHFFSVRSGQSGFQSSGIRKGLDFVSDFDGCFFARHSLLLNTSKTALTLNALMLHWAGLCV